MNIMKTFPANVRKQKWRKIFQRPKAGDKTGGVFAQLLIVNQFV